MNSNTSPKADRYASSFMKIKDKHAILFHTIIVNAKGLKH